jgi:hypothetical protein
MPKASGVYIRARKSRVLFDIAISTLPYKNYTKFPAV